MIVHRQLLCILCNGRTRFGGITLAVAPALLMILSASSCGARGEGAYGSEAPVVTVEAPASEQPGEAARSSEPGEVIFEGKLKPPLQLSASVTPEGVWLSTSSGAIATGCLRLGDGVTVPVRGEVQDKAAITACAKRIKHARAEFGDEKAVTVYGLASLKYETVIQVINALRGDEEEELFPDVTVAVKR